MATTTEAPENPKMAVDSPQSASAKPAEVLALAPPGLLGKLTEEQRDALLSAIEWEHAQPPNPAGNPHWRRGGMFEGPTNVPGPLRKPHVANRIVRSYLEEGIMEYHVRQGKKLGEVSELLGYSYAYVIARWSEMKRRAFDEEGCSEAPGELRTFILHHLHEVVKIASARVEENAAYGAVVIRACEALRDIEGLESQNAQSLDIEALAAEVKGRSPLLLETIQHSETAREATEQGEGGAETE